MNNYTVASCSHTHSLLLNVDVVIIFVLVKFADCYGLPAFLA